MPKRAIVLLMFAAASLRAQGDSTVMRGAHYVRNFALGAASSILLHEMGHIGASLALGAHPTFGFDTFRPTIFSGISEVRDPRKQFVFSSAGLDVQTILDEAILDIPHRRGGAFERGLLAGGIGTTVFYLTIGRTGSVSDVDFMARTHVMNKTEVTLLYGTFAAMHAWRITGDEAYAHFFAAPKDHGMVFGWSY
jgi:hypothetical protein